MNEKEVGEIRRHIKRERCNITGIYGCYVNENKNIVAQYRASTGMMGEDEADKYYALLRKVLSGSIGKNLIDISFQTSQVADSPEHKLLMDLRKTTLQDEELRMALFQKIIDSVVLEGNYLILLACDAYDVPFKSKDDMVQQDASDETYTYLICAICPVKEAKTNLHYVPEEKEFHDGLMSQPVSAPELGFLFPAFDNRSTNIYNALYYTRNVKEGQDGLVDALFHTPVPKPAAEQKKDFEALLTTALGEECSMEVVQAVHEELCQRIEMHKESKIPDPLLIGKEDVKDVLTACGISEAAISKFSVDYDEVFGFEADLHPKNIIDSKHFEVRTPDVSIKVDPTCSNLIETRMIDGVKYILITADENVEVNGVSVNLKTDSAAPAIG